MIRSVWNGLPKCLTPILVCRQPQTCGKSKGSFDENGTDPEVLNQVYTPIGLNIGAETPEEIGVAIMAEIIQVKNQKLRSAWLSNRSIPLFK